MNKKVRTLIQKLGEAIHESVSESEDIAGVVGEIREQGFDVMLMLEATIGLNELDEGKAVEPAGLLGAGKTEARQIGSGDRRQPAEAELVEDEEHQDG